MAYENERGIACKDAAAELVNHPHEDVWHVAIKFFKLGADWAKAREERERRREIQRLVASSASPDPFDTEADQYRAMGIVLAMIDGMRESKPKPGTPVKIVWKGGADLIEKTARVHFGDAWDPFVQTIHERTGH